MAKKTRKKVTKKEKKALKNDVSASYNEYKMFEGHQYTGMKIGRSHKWYYDKGVWKDKKITPDEWEIDYTVTKRRAGHAPKGSGAAIGTGYHWYIIAHQHVTKLNEDDYSTSLVGLKFKLAHKRADKETWSASPKAKRNRMIKILKKILAELEGQVEMEENVIPLERKKKKVAKKIERKKAA
ncbi:MAG: hypothetical protein ACJ76H_01915 [Bacteriovoracaceae bacterium]